jgi:hypothetical protein
MERKSTEIFIMRCQLNTEKVSVSDLTRLWRGQISNCTEKDIYMFVAKEYLIILILFSL